MATIDPGQDYDVIHTLTFAVGSGTCAIRLYRGSSSVFSGTVYYRAGTSGSWTPLSVSGIATTFPVSSTTMQIGHAHNKDGNNYMTVSFRGPSTNLTGMAISQKAVYSGVMGDYFMSYYAYDCAGLSSLAIPDTSGITSVGDFFMAYYARGCSGLASLAIPDTIGMTSAGTNFMYHYARDCISLLRLELPAAGWFVARNVTWGVPFGRLGLLKGYVKTSADLAAWQTLTATNKTLWLNYVQSTGDVILEGAGGAGRLISRPGCHPLISGPGKHPLISWESGNALIG